MENPRERDENLTVVFRAQDEFVADIVMGLLASEKIPVMLKSRQVPQMDGVMKMGEGYWGDIVVPHSYASRAREIIEAYQQISDEPETSEEEKFPQ
ncbi:MAG: putative signal transducing protein [Armatimonadota bacterium]